MGRQWYQSDNMKVLIVLPVLVASIACDAEADALYGGYGYGGIGPAALGYPYAYAQGNALSYAAPLRAAAPIPVARSYAAVAKPAVRVLPAQRFVARPAVRAAVAVQPVGQVVAKAAPVAAIPTARASAPLVKAAASAATSQFHAQDELGNFSYGYDNPNSASSVSGNSQVVSGTFVNKAQGTATNFVSDAFGYRQI